MDGHTGTVTVNYSQNHGEPAGETLASRELATSKVIGDIRVKFLTAALGGQPP